MEQKTVFISYRRSLSKHLARSIYMDLRAKGWDVFLDVNTIDSGDFDRIILNQIGARAHFILLISPDSLKRCANPGDWVLREIEEAVQLERNIVPIIEEGADFTREMSYLPDPLRAVVSKKNALPLTHFYFEEGMDKLRNRFLKTPEYVTITTPSADEQAEAQRRMASVDADPRASSSSPLGIPAATKRRSSLDLMPQPFAWIDIPGTTGKTWQREPYEIAKYPITNAQFAKFVEAGGYTQGKWWTDAGWQQCEKDGWTEPRFWKDTRWNGTELPVVGVSWYESVAFCLWLTDITGEEIMLPTEDQWQYAAQGDDGWEYPWGNELDAKRCNTLESKIGKTTPVRQYEGKGDSPFGVVDMAGNIWEWCLTDYQKKMNDINSITNDRVVRGGSWHVDSSYACAAYRHAWHPSSRNYSLGFRVVRRPPSP
jgi:Sulfatase-modifying factor enzyme 1/TIR domain